MNSVTKDIFIFCGCVSLALLAGCSGDNMPENRGKIELVREGWSLAQVKNKIGRPEYVIYGKSLREGHEEWVYPAGSVFFYRLSVLGTVKRSASTPPPRRPEANPENRMNPFRTEEAFYQRQRAKKSFWERHFGTR